MLQTLMLNYKNRETPRTLNQNKTSLASTVCNLLQNWDKTILKSEMRKFENNL